MHTGPGDPELAELARKLGALLLARGHRLVTAESCTGGWVAKTVTDIAGSSQWFERGFVVYSNESKQELLGVPGSTIERYGAVSEETVQAMAAGALRCGRGDCAVAISGIAGPDGGTSSKPVGTVWIAWLLRGQACRCVHHIFDGDREEVRRLAVAFALHGLIVAYGGV